MWLVRQKWHFCFIPSPTEIYPWDQDASFIRTQDASLSGHPTYQDRLDTFSFVPKVEISHFGTKKWYCVTLWSPKWCFVCTTKQSHATKTATTWPPLQREVVSPTGFSLWVFIGQLVCERLWTSGTHKYRDLSWEEHSIPQLEPTNIIILNVAKWRMRLWKAVTALGTQEEMR